MALERCTEQACFGCGACVAVCPKDAITLVPGEGGFLYPKLDAARCVRCGRCDAVCPIDAEGLTHPPKQAYAAWADEPTRASSTSGGAFSAIARTILKQGGAVCGAELLLPEGRVRHVCVEDESGLARLRKSKYVQSETAPALRDALVEHHILDRMVRDIRALLAPEDAPEPPEETVYLWDNTLGAVPNATNHSHADREESPS